MSTHRLSEMRIEGREIVLQKEPLFDLHRIRRMRRVTIEFDGGDQTTLVIVAQCQVNMSTYDLTIKLDGVRQLVLPEMEPCFNVSELEILDARDKRLEGINFEVTTQYDRSF